MTIFQVVNFISISIIFTWATWCVLSPSIKDGVLGKLMFSTISLAAFSCIIHTIQDGLILKHIVTLHAALAAVAVRHIFIHTCWGSIKRYYFEHLR